MRKSISKFGGVLAVPAVLAAIVAAGPSSARAPYTEEELQQQMDSLVESVSLGYDLWHGSKPEMTTNGLACGNCHPDTAASNPQTFPKYMPMFGKVVPFRDMVNWCIETPQLGQALDVNSPEMTAMEAYAFKLHRGLPIEPGLASRQTSSIPVESGKGFPHVPTGLGVDK
jgi:thiosulfate dehydrogenase